MKTIKKKQVTKHKQKTKIHKPSIYPSNSRHNTSTRPFTSWSRHRHATVTPRGRSAAAFVTRLNRTRCYPSYALDYIGYGTEYGV